MTVRNAGPESLASWSAATTPGHVGRCPGLVDEHQTIRIEIELGIEPVPAPLQDVQAVLLGRVRGLFLNVRPQRSRKIQSVARAAYTSRSAASLSSISLMVMSGVAATSNHGEDRASSGAAVPDGQLFDRRFGAPGEPSGSPSPARSETVPPPDAPAAHRAQHQSLGHANPGCKLVP